MSKWYKNKSKHVNDSYKINYIFTFLDSYRFQTVKRDVNKLEISRCIRVTKLLKHNHYVQTKVTNITSLYANFKATDLQTYVEFKESIQ